MTHTPGPWTLTDWNKVSSNGELVAATKHTGHIQEDARLIAAAPELLEAAKLLIEIAESGDADVLPAIDAARAAISKAKGG